MTDDLVVKARALSQQWREMAEWSRKHRANDPAENPDDGYYKLSEIHDQKADELDALLADVPPPLSGVVIVGGSQHQTGSFQWPHPQQAKSGTDVPPPPPSGWQPIETCPRSGKLFFWLVPKTADESYVDTSGKPITVNHPPYQKECEWGCWGALSKPIFWHPPLPAPPRDQEP